MQTWHIRILSLPFGMRESSESSKDSAFLQRTATANMKALDLLSWSTAEANALTEQFEQLAAVPNYPGSYIIARYTNFAFLDAVNNDVDPAEALQSYVTVINKELSRKRKEFDGKVFVNPQTGEKDKLELPQVPIGEEPPTKTK